MVLLVRCLALVWKATHLTLFSTEEEAFNNAKLAISIARKLGATIFLVPEDIVEVRAKMVSRGSICLTYSNCWSLMTVVYLELDLYRQSDGGRETATFLNVVNTLSVW